jgi:serine protease Do
MKRRLLLVVWALILLGGNIEPLSPAHAIDKMQPKVLAAFRDVVNHASHSTVKVLAEGKQIALGAIVSTDGYITTKASELKGTVQVQLHDGRKLDARVVSSERDLDLALLKIDAEKLPVAPWSTGPAPLVGSWLATPDLRKEPVSIGVVSVAPRTIPAPSAALGIELGSDSTQARINDIIKGSAAQKAGLQTDDIIRSVAGKEIAGPRQLVETIRNYRPGEKVDLVVERGTEKLNIAVVLGSRSQILHGERSEFQNSLGGPLSERRGGFTQAIQHDSVLTPKDCGGPVVDLEGKVVGINIARASRVESYALPVSVVRPALDELLKKAGAMPLAPAPGETLQTSVK